MPFLSCAQVDSTDRVLMLRYGNDPGKWPVWLRNPGVAQEGMSLDSLSLDKLTYNGKTISFNEDIDFQIVSETPEYKFAL